MDYGMLNVGSLVLGIAALALPVVVLVRKMQLKRGFVCLMASMVCCMTAILFQMAYQDHLVDIEDWSALMDTSKAMLSVSAQLALVTAVLNAAAFAVRAGGKNPEK